MGSTHCHASRAFSYEKEKNHIMRFLLLFIFESHSFIITRLCFIFVYDVLTLWYLYLFINKCACLERYVNMFSETLSKGTNLSHKLLLIVPTLLQTSYSQNRPLCLVTLTFHFPLTLLYLFIYFL